MANKNIITSQGKTVQTEQLYYMPILVTPTQPDVPIGTMYCFLSKVEPWSDDESPEQPRNDVVYQKQVFKNMFAAKLITAADICPVIPRINWETGTLYDYYKDDVDMNAVDDNGIPVYRFYVKNKYNQVFKCLFNANGGLSTDEPVFEPGYFNTNGVFSKTDGYKWKYMYSIDNGLKVNFMDDSWMPVAIGANTPNPIQTLAGAGSIEVINVLNGGANYDPANTPVTLTITGADGSGLSGTVSVDNNGVVTDVTVISSGGDYTYANVTVTSTVGGGAVLEAPSSPVGGHGFDPISELGCKNVMVTSTFDGDEGGILPVDIDYHQIGVLINPTAHSTYPNPANSSIYRTTTDLLVSSGFGNYVADEYVYQGSSLQDSSFSARVLYFDTSTNQLMLINKVGTPIINAQIYGDVSKTTRTLLSYNTSDFVPFSGYISYIENRSGVQRSADGIEQFRFVLGY